MCVRVVRRCLSPTRFSWGFFANQAFLLGVVYLTFALWRLVEVMNSDLGGNTVAAEFMLYIKTRQVCTSSKDRLQLGRALITTGH